MSETIFAMPNHHIESCGTPPNVVGTLGYPNIYHGYFENCFGEQWIFSYDPHSKEALLRGGDVEWDNVLTVKNGVVVDLVLSKSERDWLVACWNEATMWGRGADYKGEGTGA